ncbi:MAG: hypothetical protein GQ540_03485 [Lutibacter sp.]|uniref:hypothetical protein n=1 Tax=Lutibacter sp. TaxID=1925666 RepID=UPI001A028CB1|nr:hypothetical protein [Lutibacter sp.]NOR27575.1 hypothetical protein [Lutibacter sp.]
MRISVDRKSEYYKSNCVGLKPYLNGKYVRGCVEADDINGWVRKYRFDNDGNYVMAKFQDYILEEIVYGIVELRKENEEKE